MVRKLVLAVAAASALMSSNMVQALGVGEINLRSALNQPLEAEIELLQVRDLTGDEIRSVLASPDDFGRAGIDRSFFLTDLTFTPVVDSNGKAYIKVTSDRPVKEPYLNFLMEVRWPSGRVLREFTLLLDPPLYDPTPVPFSAPVAPLSTATGTVRPSASAAAPASSAAMASATATDRQRRTTRDDTLWGIALETRPQGSSVHQTMLAIQDLNPNAFIGNNINTLKADQTLRLPTAEEAGVRSQAEAIAEVGNQTTAWQSRRASPEPAQRQLDARERSEASEAPAQTSGEDTLRVVAGSADDSDDSVSSSGGENGSLRDVLDQTKEQLDSAEQEKNELADRLADVEGQLETLQRLLTLKDAQLAALQRELANDGELPDILPVPDSEAEVEEETQLEAQSGSVPAEEGDADQSGMTGVQAQTDLAELEALTQSGSETEEDGQGVAGEEEQVALVPTVATPDPSGSGPNGGTAPSAPETPDPTSTPAVPEAQPSVAQNSSPAGMLQRFLQSQTLLLGTGAAALLILLLVLMAVARRNARREAELADDYLASAPDEASAGDEGDAFNVALTSAGDEAVQEEALDPLVEADDLVARNELNEAADLLEDAIDQEPERVDLRLKMMEIEAGLENQQGYAIQVEALKRMGVTGSAVEMMNARFPLMAAGLVVGTALAGSAGEPEQGGIQVEEQPLLEESDLLDASLSEADTADFDFTDFGLVDETAAASLADVDERETGFDLDFDLDESTSTTAALEQPVELSVDEPVFEELQLDTGDATVDDYDLGLDDELQVENLLAEFEAMGTADEAALQPETGSDSTGEDAGFTLSDDDLAGFEVQLQAELQGDASASAVAGLAEQDNDLATYDNMASASEDAMTDGLGEDFDFLSDTDECATKLDLARAYIDMGDEEGARDILAEVVSEGNEQQQQDAREMMEQLG